MKMEIGRYSIKIIPECDLDTAYLEEVLGLGENGPGCNVSRESVMSFPGWLASCKLSRNTLTSKKD